MFDKDEDGKLTEDELREIMVQMGDHPISEEEFENFITVIIKLTPIKHRATKKVTHKHTVASVTLGKMLQFFF